MTQHFRPAEPGSLILAECCGSLSAKKSPAHFAGDFFVLSWDSWIRTSA
ncbi:hypothetical protein L248_1531 [Schleiferilactobacillus shenzhenensis LY-73]|uniref:Uncharacterized protein n=1 Tax=Schleiferilactobacillus shenzhenensis LY-73 TaxID=1231336 RepID=U4TIY2_9LACO|nr:hypothetical protein L248_1531 [Schleiferilactobacillus shenzhenensis LY-73]